MFGGRSFMVDDRMVVSARKGGRLLVRVAPERHEELLDRPGAAPAEMGRGRRMGVGWIEVAPEAISEDEHLLEWVRIALSHDPRERTTSP